MACDHAKCSELFLAWLRTYNDDPANSNEVKDFQLAGTHHFHDAFRAGKITAAEYGTIVDFILCW